MRGTRSNQQLTLGSIRDKNPEVLHVSCREIRFVLPRPVLKDHPEVVQFLFPWQHEPCSNNTVHAKVRERLRWQIDQGDKRSKEFRSLGQSAGAVIDAAVRITENTKSRKGGEGEKPLVSKKDDNKHDIEEICNCSKMLIRSVEDAMKDEKGWRPRANSTDLELKLPQRGLCDERIVLQSHKWDMERLYKRNGPAQQILPPPRGFVNMGNTCFLNATLQCLAYMPSFCQLITSLSNSNYKTNKGGNHGQRITMFLRSLLRMAHGIAALERNEPPKTSPITPKGLHKAITSCKINGHRFRPGRQEDAHELLVHLLDAMHEGELFAAGINPHASGWRDKLPIPRLDETTFVHRIFGGYFRSQLKCNKCGYKSNTYDPFLDLALEVSKSHIDSLSAAFLEFTRKETLDSKNRWKCSGCENYVCPTKHLSVFRPPLSLCVHLKRFGFEEGESFTLGGWGCGHRHSKGLSTTGNGGSKISKKIDYPAHLSLPLSDGRVCQYLLTGVIIHVGNTATTGHYTSYVKQPGVSKLWCHMDDSFVEMVSENTVLKQRDAYVLFYTRKEVTLEFPPPGELMRRNDKNRKPLGGVNILSFGGKKGSSAHKHQQCALESSGDRSRNAMGRCDKSEGIMKLPPQISTSLVATSSNDISSMAPSPLANEANCSTFESSFYHPRASSPGRGNLADIKRSLSYIAGKNQFVQKNDVVFCAKQRRTWNPFDTAELDSGNGEILLGNINVRNLNDRGSDHVTVMSSREEKPSPRSTATKKILSTAWSKKRKTRMDFWDSLLDKVERTKKQK